jgi:hypothetical protein
VDVDLEVEVAADRAGVACLADEADRLTGVNAVAAMDHGRARHVGVEVGAVLAFAMDQEVVAVEDRVIAAVQDAAASDGDQGRATGGDDVEALVDTSAVPRGAEFADRPPRAVRSLDGEDVTVVGDTAVAVGDAGGGGSGDGREEEER